MTGRAKLGIAVVLAAIFCASLFFIVRHGGSNHPDAARILLNKTNAELVDAKINYRKFSESLNRAEADLEQHRAAEEVLAVLNDHSPGSYSAEVEAELNGHIEFLRSSKRMFADMVRDGTMQKSWLDIHTARNYDEVNQAVNSCLDQNREEIHNFSPGIIYLCVRERIPSA